MHAGVEVRLGLHRRESPATVVAARRREGPRLGHFRPPPLDREPGPVKAAAVRLDSEDFAWAVMAVKIQREVGGNLSELLMTVGDTMTARERLRRDVASLTAEGKMSAIVLGVLPILLGAAMWVMNQDYINTLFTNTLGKILLGVSITAALIGFAWMKKIIDIEI